MHQSIPPKTSPGPGAIAESQIVPPPGPPAFSLHVDGPVPEDALYISRDADDDLFEGLLRGELCSLLAPPRSGKSSLAARVARRLQGRGVRTANIDLQRISHRVSLEGFAYALVGQLAEGLGLGDPTGFFVKHEALSPSERFSLYLREELLNHIAAPVVVFIDEIDALQMLRSGADDFAAVIRGIYEDRPQVAALRRLSFCLVGSQPPEDLLSPRPSQTSMPTAPTKAAAPRQSPFPTARIIELRDFSPAEAALLLTPVAQSGDGDAPQLLKRVLYWTDGHPHMTIRLVQALTRTRRSFATNDDEHVDRLVQKLLIAQSGGDPSLSAASRRFTTAPDLVRLLALSLYRRLLFKERVPSRRPGKDSREAPITEEELEQHRAQEVLRLMGMIKEYSDESGVRWLRVRNLVFENAFGPSWIEEKGQGRVLTDMLTRWLRSGKRPDFLLRGKELDEVLGWSTLAQPKTPDEEEFLRAALALRQEEELRVTKEALEAENRMRLHAKQEQRRERAALLALLVASGLVGVGATATLSGRLRAAEREATQAQKQAWDSYNAADRAEKQRLQTTTVAQAALRRLFHLGQPALRQRPASDDPAEAGARRVLEDALGEGAQQRGALSFDERRQQAAAVVDGLYAAALAQELENRPETRIEALLASAQVLLGRPGVETQAPAAVQGLVGAVSESLSQATTESPLPVLRGHGGYVRGAEFSPDGRMILTLSDDRSARLWDARSGKALAVLGGHSGLLNAAHFSPDGKAVVTASNDHSARLYRIVDSAKRSGAPSVEKPADPAKADATKADPAAAPPWTIDVQTVATLGGHSADVRAAGFAPDGKLVVTASGDGTARLWDGAGRLQQVLRGHSRDIVAAVFLPDGARVLTASLDGTARLWSAADGKSLAVLSGHEGPVLAAAVAPDGARLATTGADHTARLWDGASGAAQRALQGHLEAVTAVSFSGDGKTLLTASTDRTARLWDAETGAALATLGGHGGPVLTAVFSPDGARVLTASSDRTARLFFRDGQPLGALRGHALALSAAAFSPDGEWLVTTSGDRSGRLYPGTVPRFLDVACQLLAPRPEAQSLKAACEARRK